MFEDFPYDLFLVWCRRHPFVMDSPRDFRSLFSPFLFPPVLASLHRVGLRRGVSAVICITISNINCVIHH